jgi:hypothetical protein
MDWLLKLIFFLLVFPIVLGVAAQMIAAFIWAVLPWLLVLALLAGVAAGLSAGLVLRRRLPPRINGDPLVPNAPLGPYRVRRPRGGGGGRR